jgi:phage terminase small subunit
MGQEIAIPNDRKYDGRAMAQLSDQRRAFVIAMMEQGVNPKAAPDAAVACGYAEKYGYELMRDEAILTAIREEATKRLAGAALVGVNVLLEIALNGEHRDQFKAAKQLAAINGFTAEQRIVVEHITTDNKTMIIEIRNMAKELGMDPVALLRSIGVAEDAEFIEVPENDTIN